MSHGIAFDFDSGITSEFLFTSFVVQIRSDIYYSLLLSIVSLINSSILSHSVGYSNLINDNIKQI